MAHVLMPELLFKWVEKRARRDGRSVDLEIELALRRWLDEHQPAQGPRAKLREISLPDDLFERLERAAMSNGHLVNDEAILAIRKCMPPKTPRERSDTLTTTRAAHDLQRRGQLPDTDVLNEKLDALSLRERLAKGYRCP